MGRLTISARACSLLLFTSTLLVTAFAAPVASAQARPPTTAYTVRYVHDGFYVRMAAGFGVTQVSVERQSAGPDAQARIPGLALDFLLGTTPLRGIVVGGGMLLDTGKLDLERRDLLFDSDDAAGTTTFAAMLDVFPDAYEGLHFGGAFGYSIFNVSSDERGTSAVLARGVAGGVWVGYDAWLSAEWSIGSLLRVQRGHMTSDEGPGYAVDTSSVAVLFTALYQ
jgi:hypothetical protein